MSDQLNACHLGRVSAHASLRGGTARGTGGERTNLTRVLEATMNGPWEDRFPALG